MVSAKGRVLLLLPTAMALLLIPSFVTNVWHADPTIPLDILCIFDPFGNATHTTLSFKVLGEDVLITGAGPIGSMAAAVCRHARWRRR